MINKFYSNRPADVKKLDQILKSVDGEKVDNYHLFLKDLFEIRHPDRYKKASEKELKDFAAKFKAEAEENKGIWIYYPWLRKAYLTPPEEIYFEIYTARNKPIISSLEQKQFYNFNLGVVGLSVGQSAAITIVRSGGAKNLKIADPDTIDPSNLNRLQTGLPSIGELKTKAVSERLLEINPYSNIIRYDEGLTKSNLDDFFSAEFKLDAVIDAADDIEIKIALRKEARKQRIPVLMATDVGNGALIDIERFDLEPEKAIFSGRINEDAKPMSREEFIKLGLSIISVENLSLPLVKAMKEVGKTIPTHPQLGISAYFTGVVMAYTVRHLSLGKTFPSERIYIDLDKFLNAEVLSQEYANHSQEAIQELKQLFGI